MRIISGKYKGRRITAPKNLPARPTTDIAKEALFNILNNNYYFNSLSVLDLFAGIGSISFEFASRGTENITSVDQHYNSLKFIDKTAKELDLARERYAVITAASHFELTNALTAVARARENLVTALFQ
mgnify:CR=1 FL=1